MGDGEPRESLRLSQDPLIGRDIGEAVAMVFEGPGKPLVLSNIPLPEKLGPGEVLVSMLSATICGSDLHTWLGRRQEPVPLVLGHEGVGIVLAKGVGREALPIGQRVSWSIADSCGTCPFCQEFALPQKCVSLAKYGHASLADGSGLNGCYGTHLVLRAGTTVVPVGPVLPDSFAATANCALATMVHAIEQLPSGVSNVLLQGAGLLGLYGAMLLRERKISTVYLCDGQEDRLELARDMGFRAIPVSGSGADQLVTVLRRSHPYGLDAVIEASGSRSAFTAGIELLRPGGFYVNVGLVHPDSALELTGERLIRQCLTLVGVHNYAPWHLIEAVRFMERNVAAFPVERLVSPAYPLPRMEEALQEAATGRWMRVALDCRLS